MPVGADDADADGAAFRGVSCPFDGDASFLVNGADAWAAGAVNGDASAACDVADDVVTGEGFAAFGVSHENVVHAAYAHPNTLLLARAF